MGASTAHSTAAQTWSGSSCPSSGSTAANSHWIHHGTLWYIPEGILLHVYTTIHMPSINSIKHKGIGLEPCASFSIEVDHANAKQKQIYDLMCSWMLDSKKPSSKCSTPTQPFFILLLLGCQNSMHTSVENLFKTIVRQNSKMNLMVFA